MKRKGEKSAGALDQAPQEAVNVRQDERPEKQRAALLRISEAAELFRAKDGTAYARVPVGDHKENWSIRSQGFQDWLVRGFFEETGGAPNSESLTATRNVLEARARFGSESKEVFLRVAEHEERIYLDLGTDDWRVVEIDANGWHVVEDPPVRFTRSNGMQPLPKPEKGGSVDLLRDFINVAHRDDFVLVVAWLVAALGGKPPFPVLVLAGEQGSAKSTLASVLKELVDPSSAPLRALPRDERELFISATNGHVLAFDNVSGLPHWMSDTFCRLASGGGFAVRRLYTDQDEVLFEAAKPFILNGIEDFVNRPDLADRSIFLTLDPIADSERRSERELRTDFREAAPKILGALCDAVSNGLRNRAEVKCRSSSRMADFVMWLSACEIELWEKGTFARAYERNREAAVRSVIEADAVASAVCELVANGNVWAGTATRLLTALATYVADPVVRSKDWPKTPQALSARLKRAATFLRKCGIHVEFSRQGRRRDRIITISSTRVPQIESSSAPSAVVSRDERDERDDGDQVAPNRGAAGGVQGDDARSRVGDSENAVADDADGADDGSAGGPRSLH